MNDSPRTIWSISELLQMVTDRDLLILKDLEQLRLLSTRQIQRLRFTEHISAASATRTTVRVLDRLEHRGLITRLPRRVGGSARGSAANVWQLAATGERLLRRLSGHESRRRYVEPSPQFTAHTLAVAETAVQVFEATYLGDFDLLELETEPDCWREYLTPAGTRETLKPDLFVVTANAEVESHAFVEVDLATEHLPAVLRKCETYQRYWRTGQEQAARDLFPAVVWIVPTPARAEKIRSAIRDHPTLTADLFIITTPDQTLAVLGPGEPINPLKGGTP
jgi:hypothetical protein